ncbi:hypothetical protein FACS1894200_10260 [Spirochaetia bacterium]|nr:hypothetical protein FACS1894200_10260 [Spirochaetia bacterium]
MAIQSGGFATGFFHFLRTLGFQWPNPTREKTPFVDLVHKGLYPLPFDSHYQASNAQNIAQRRRLVIERKDFFRNTLTDIDSLIRWTARNSIDFIVIPLDKNKSAHTVFGTIRNLRDGLIKKAEMYAIGIERGGWDLSFFVPRGYYFINREIFRMYAGRRRIRYNFCPTNPDTTALVTKEAVKCFKALPQIRVFHLWPDRGHEQDWCSCPSCRAFSLEELKRIAVNTAADALAAVNPAAYIVFHEKPGSQNSIPLRGNLIRLEYLPREKGAEEAGIFIID